MALRDMVGNLATAATRHPVVLASASLAEVPLYEPAEIASRFQVDSCAAIVDGRVHERDFHFFDGLLEGKVFCDIGANIGQSISSLSGLKGVGRIHAFEINPLLLDSLRENTRPFGLDLTIHDFGAGEHDADVDLFLPVLQRTVAHTLGSLDLEALKQPNIAYHLRQMRDDVEPRVIRVRARIRNFDALDLAPDYIKIDAEGAEMEVLKGMPRTLAERRPVLMIENSFEASVRNHMLGFGYLPFVYVRPLHALIMSEAEAGQSLVSANTFYLHYLRIPEFQALGRIVSVQQLIHRWALDHMQAGANSTAPLDEPPGPADVAYAYRLILGTPPHFAHFMYHYNCHATIRALRDTFIAALPKQ